MIQFIKTKTFNGAKVYVLGTTVYIETILSDELASSDLITIQIQDAWDRIKVEDVAMAEVTPGVYSYAWQTTVGGITDEAGTYTAFVSVTVDSNTYVDYTTFELVNFMEE